jgi:hypothetical protein
MIGTFGSNTDCEQQLKAWYKALSKPTGMALMITKETTRGAFMNMALPICFQQKNNYFAFE